MLRRLLDFCRILTTKEKISARTYYTSIFKTFFHEKLFRRRVESDITQEEMAGRLVMASRTYVDLDPGKTGCSALTLALFLIYICADAKIFLEELRDAFENGSNKAA